MCRILFIFLKAMSLVLTHCSLLRVCVLWERRLDSFLFPVLLPHKVCVCLLALSFPKITFLFAFPLSFLSLFFCFSCREKYVQMLDQIARQMIDFYKDLVTQRVMDQRILEELYNFKNVIEELTRWKPWGSSTQSRSQSPVFTCSKRKPWRWLVNDEDSFAFSAFNMKTRRTGILVEEQRLGYSF